MTIDPERVKFIETQERIQWIKDNWRKLDHAEKFIRFWFSGMINLSKTSESLCKTEELGSSFVRFLFGALTNWVTAPSAKDVDFSGYLQDRLRE